MQINLESLIEATSEESDDQPGTGFRTNGLSRQHFFSLAKNEIMNLNKESNSLAENRLFCGELVRKFRLPRFVLSNCFDYRLWISRPAKLVLYWTMSWLSLHFGAP